MKDFIKKWSNWWIFNPLSNELTSAFERELKEIIAQETKVQPPYFTSHNFWYGFGLGLITYHFLSILEIF